MFRKRRNAANLKNKCSTDSWNEWHHEQRPRTLTKYLKRSKRTYFFVRFIVLILLVGIYVIIVTLVSNDVRPAHVRLVSMKPRAKPLIIGCYFNHTIETSVVLKVRPLKVHDEENRYPSKRQVEWTARDENFQKELRDSKKYKKEMPEQREKNGCKLPFEWQRRYIPTCNCIHEYDFTSFYMESSTGVDEHRRLVASGFWRDVWKIQDEGIPKQSWVAAKTLRTIHPYTARNLDRHRRDALATARTSSSPFTINMFAFCGHTVLTEYSQEGSLSDAIWPVEGNCTLSAKQRFRYALDVAKGLVDLQHADRPDVATISHTDITPSQYMILNGTIKLNDFNRARFITFDEKSGQGCPFRVGMNPGKYRSPEEYAFEDETEKIDVYAMGNVFYSLLTELWPYHELSVEEAQDRIKNGKHPDVSRFMNSTNPYEKILVNAIVMSWTKDPKKRPSSKDILSYLQTESKQTMV